jgi:ABC-2 type transport system permease protein
MNSLAKLATSVAKESRIILRDRQALILFFIMPVLFVLILSLALRDAFGDRPGATFDVLVADQDGGEVGEAVVSAFAASGHFRVERAGQPVPDLAELERAILEDRYKFVILIPADASQQAQKRVEELAANAPPEMLSAAPVELQLLADPTLRLDYRTMVRAALAGTLQGMEMKFFGRQLEQNLKAMGIPAELPHEQNGTRIFAEVRDQPLHSGDKHIIPSSVQQNAPAWTLLAMFFLTVPLSVSFIKEREQGSLFRLQTMAVPGWVVLGGKTLPYFIINQIQMASILLVSVYVLPLLGGDRLDIGHSPLALVLLGAAASLAAIGFGIAVALFSRTAEQAASFSSAVTMIMAALGGILVPLAVMPPLMQQFAMISPLAWGLNGFLDVFVRGGGVVDVIPEALGLLAFSAACHALAIMRYSSRL